MRAEAALNCPECRAPVTAPEDTDTAVQSHPRPSPGSAGTLARTLTRPPSLGGHGGTHTISQAVTVFAFQGCWASPVWAVKTEERPHCSLNLPQEGKRRGRH